MLGDPTAPLSTCTPCCCSETSMRSWEMFRAPTLSPASNCEEQGGRSHRGFLCEYTGWAAQSVSISGFKNCPTHLTVLCGALLLAVGVKTRSSKERKRMRKPRKKWNAKKLWSSPSEGRHTCVVVWRKTCCMKSGPKPRCAGSAWVRSSRSVTAGPTSRHLLTA